MLMYFSMYKCTHCQVKKNYTISVSNSLQQAAIVNIC